MVIVLFFVEDLIEALGIISARLGLIWFIGFRGEDLNVKVYSIQRTNVWMPSDGKRSCDFWPGELKKTTSMLIILIYLNYYNNIL
jgi:hypothetical protein